MEISKEHRQEMEQIIADMEGSGPKCRKNYECYKSTFEKICNTKNIGTLIECLENEEACACGLSFSFGDSHFCKCPLRRYIAHKENAGSSLSPYSRSDIQSQESI